ncbi:hypothetical protein EBU99_07195 [bacterium]|nr:hypothetical protein [bacterium]
MQLRKQIQNRNIGHCGDTHSIIESHEAARFVFFKKKFACLPRSTLNRSVASPATKPKQMWQSDGELISNEKLKDFSAIFFWRVLLIIFLSVRHTAS